MHKAHPRFTLLRGRRELGEDQGASQILALANGDEKMRDATPAGLSLSEQLLKIHALTIKEQRNLLIGRHFRHPAFYSASNQNPVLAAP